MKLTIPVKDLSQALATAVLAVEKKTTIPILSNVKLEAKNGKLYLDATDLERWVSLSIPANVEQEGTITVPAARIADYVKLLPHADVALEVSTAKRLLVKCGRSRTALPGMSVENFPEKPVCDEGRLSRFDIPGEWLPQIQSRIGFAIANSDSRLTLTAAQLDFQAAQLVSTATDGHRMSRLTLKPSTPFTAPAQALIAKSTIDIASRLFGSAESVALSVEPNHILIEADGYQLIARKLSGQFPDVDRVLPSKIPPSVVDVKREELLSSISRVMKFADERSRAVKFTVNGEIVISAAAEGGEADETLPYAGEGSGSFGINSQYVHDFLHAIGSEDVQLRFTDEHYPIEFREGGGDEAQRYVVMPMRM